MEARLCAKRIARSARRVNMSRLTVRAQTSYLVASRLAELGHAEAQAGQRPSPLGDAALRLGRGVVSRCEAGKGGKAVWVSCVVDPAGELGVDVW